MDYSIFPLHWQYKILSKAGVTLMPGPVNSWGHGCLAYQPPHSNSLPLQGRENISAGCPKTFLNPLILPNSLFVRLSENSFSAPSIPQSWGKFVLGDTPKTPGRKNPASLLKFHCVRVYENSQACHSDEIHNPERWEWAESPRLSENSHVCHSEHSEESFLKLILGDSSS